MNTYGVSAILPKDCILTKGRSERLSAVVDSIRINYEKATFYNMKRTFRALKKGLNQYEDISAEDLNIEFAKCRVNQENVLKMIYGKVAGDTRPLVTDGKAVKSDNEETERWKIFIERWISENVASHVKFIDETTRADILKLFYQSETTADFRRLIDPYFTVTAPNRAYTIARTECACSTNGTMNESMKVYDTGREKVTIWNAWSDERTRQSHRAMANVTIPYGTLFHVPNVYGGIDLMEFPLDSSHGATPGNIINCRCFQSWKYV